MNTKDRELLELAAKAAGIKRPGSAYEGFIGNDGTFVFYLDCEGKTVKTWNPLEDDGDAFRLAVRLGLEVERRADREGSESLCAREKRSAIVRAAAEIGRRMA